MTKTIIVVEKTEEITVVESPKEQIIISEGVRGEKGADGEQGADGVDGADGASAYQVWLDEGNAGTEADFLLSLKGADGEQGADGADGADGEPGQDGADGEPGVGVPAGGNNGEILAKASGDDYDTEWIPQIDLSPYLTISSALMTYSPVGHGHTLSDISDAGTMAEEDAADYYTAAETDVAIGVAISSLVDSSPAALDTLNELAAALGDDPNFATTVTNALAGKAALSHAHSASEIVSGTFDDARIAESNVTQHKAALTITESQISDLGAYITANSTDTLTNKSGNISQWTNDAGYITSASPAGSTGDVQVNSGGAFAALSGFRLNLTGNARGSNALDVQNQRTSSSQVASGQDSIVFGRKSTAAQRGSIALGDTVTATGANFFNSFFSYALGIGKNVTVTSRALNPSAVYSAVAVGIDIEATLGGTVLGSSISQGSGRHVAIGEGITPNSGTISIGSTIVHSGSNNIILGRDSGGAGNIFGSFINSYHSSDTIIGNNTIKFTSNTRGVSVNNGNPLSNFHVTSDILSTDTSSLGSSIITNPTASSWTYTGNASVSGSGFTKTAGGVGTVTIPLTISSNTYYLIEMRITSFNAGTMTVSAGGETLLTFNAAPSTAADTYRATIKSSTTDNLVFSLDSACAISKIDNITVKPILGGSILAPLGKITAGTDTADASAVIQADSTTQGFLPPRMTTAQRDAISSPAEGLVIYNTTTKTNDFRDGTNWVNQVKSDVSTISGSDAIANIVSLTQAEYDAGTPDASTLYIITDA